MTEIRATDYFAIVPEYVLYAPISANAVRLFAVLHRYANANLRAWPSRKTLAEAMAVSTATVDRAKDELVGIGAMTVENRLTDQGDPTSNLYTLRMTHPGGPSSPTTKGIPTGEGRGIPTGDALNRASITQSHLRDSSLTRTYGDRAAQVAGLVRLGRDDEADDYIADQEPTIREWLAQVAAEARQSRDGGGR